MRKLIRFECKDCDWFIEELVHTSAGYDILKDKMFKHLDTNRGHKCIRTK
jgi:hypothetical protein